MILSLIFISLSLQAYEYKADLYDHWIYCEGKDVYN